MICAFSITPICYLNNNSTAPDIEHIYLTINTDVKIQTCRNSHLVLNEVKYIVFI